MLDLNRAFDNTALQLNTQFATLRLATNSQTANSSSVNFNDVLSSFQSESDSSRNETDSSAVTARLFQPDSSTHTFAPSSTASSPTASNSIGVEEPPDNDGSSATFSPGAQQQVSPITSTSSAASADAAPGSSVALTSDSVSVAPSSQPQPLIPADGQAVGGQMVDASGAANALAITQQASATAAAGSAPDVAQKNGQFVSPEKSMVPILPVAPEVSTIKPDDDRKPGNAQPLANQQAVGSSDSTPPGQLQTGLASAATGARAVDKAKSHKEGALGENKIKETAGVIGTGNDPSLSPLVTDPNSSAVSTLTPADAGATSSNPPATNSRKADSNADLAFALRIQGNTPLVNSTNPVSSSTGTTDPLAANVQEINSPTTASAFSSELTGILTASGTNTSLKPGAKSELAYPNSVAGAGLLSSSLSTGVNLVTPSDPTAAEDVSASTEAPPVINIPDDPTTNGQPIKTVQLQITGVDEQKVDVKMIEKSGSLMMSVRSSDESLTRALQQNLPDLATKLNDQQVRTEWWRPDTQQAGSSGNSGNSSSGSDNQANQDQGNQNKGNSGQQGGVTAPSPTGWKTFRPHANQIRTEHNSHGIYRKPAFP